MKKTILSLVAAAAVLAGCSKDDGVISSNNLQIKGENFYGTIAGESRTAFDEESGKIHWLDGESISIFNKSDHNLKYTVTAGTDDATTAQFTYAEEYTEGTGAAFAKNYAVYPYNEVNAMTEEGKITLNLPAVQTYNPESNFANAPMVAVAEGNALSFTNPVAYLRFKLSKQNHPNNFKMKSITVGTVNGDLKIAGKAAIDMTAAQPVVTIDDTAADASATIKLDFGEGVELTKEQACYYMVLPAVTFPAGQMTVTYVANYNGEDHTVTITKEAEITFNPNGMKSTTIEVKAEDFSGATTGSKSVWDGQTTTAPAVNDEGEYVIDTPAKFAYIMQNYPGKGGVTTTLNIAADLDMGGYELNPYSLTDNKTFVRVVVKGNNYTISNFKVAGTQEQNTAGAQYYNVGLFPNTNGLQVSNLTISGAVLGKEGFSSKDVYGGVLAGTSYGTETNPTILENVTVKNCTVYGVNKVGGLIGQAGGPKTITNCKVEHTNLYGNGTDGGSVGGLLGYVDTDDTQTITNCSVTGGSIVVADGADVAKRGSSAFIGTIHLKSSGKTTTINGCTVSNVDLTQSNTAAPAHKLVGGLRDSGTDAIMIDGAQLIASGVTKNAAGEYELSTAEGLTALATKIANGNNFAGKTIKLTSDIDLSGEFSPIAPGTRSGNSAVGTGFAGILDGNNKTISGLTITTGGADDAVGLFGVIDGGEVKNLTFTDVNINVPDCENAGTVAGLVVNGGKISGVTVSGSVTAKRGNGGIVGRLIASGEISNCVNNATLTATGANVGGIVGAAYYTAVGAEMTISNCTNNGAINSTNYGVGGIVGLSAANVVNCTNTAAVKGAGASVGGIVGEQQNAGSVINCTNKQNVTNNGADGTYGTGGIVGWIRYTGTTDNYPRKEIVEVANCENYGSVSGTADAGGIVGVLYNYGNIHDNKNYATTLTATAFAAGIVANAQFTEETPGLTSTEKAQVVNNLSTTGAANITAACTDLYVYDNSQGENLIVRGNTQE